VRLPDTSPGTLVRTLPAPLSKAAGVVVDHLRHGTFQRSMSLLVAGTSVVSGMEVAYPRGYMRLEEGEAEPWEADEQRYDWAAPQDTLSDGSGQAPAADSSPRGQAGAH